MFYRTADGHPLPHDPFKALVTPRPIGWISSISADGQVNLAPYSFFNGCGDSPPMVMFAQTGRKTRETEEKDSIANIRETSEFACNIVGRDLANAMNLSSGQYDRGEDEFEIAGLTKAPCEVIAPPRVAEAPAVLECKLVRIVEDLPTWKDHARNIMVIGEVVGVHIDDAVLVDGKVDVLAFNPLARMGYMDYTAVTDKFELRRPGQ
ncbi:MAG: flavin reductase family protein [Pseudomonadota bacterium]